MLLKLVLFQTILKLLLQLSMIKCLFLIGEPRKTTLCKLTTILTSSNFVCIVGQSLKLLESLELRVHLADDDRRSSRARILLHHRR